MNGKEELELLFFSVSDGCVHGADSGNRALTKDGTVFKRRGHLFA